MTKPYLSKAGHVLMAKAAQKAFLRDAKRGLWSLSGCARNDRDWHLSQARQAY